MQRKISFGILNYPIRCLGIIIGFILLNSQNPTTAQQFVYQNFTTDDGLPSSECYDVIQDEKGYIWIATDKGIAKYNGQEFKVFDLGNGLKSSTVFRLLEANGRIWFFTHNKYLQYIEYDTVVTPIYSKDIRFLLDSLKGQPGELSVDQNNNLLISINQFYKPHNYLEVDSNGHILVQLLENTDRHNVNIINRKNHKPVSSFNYNFLTSENRRYSVNYSNQKQQGFSIPLNKGSQGTKTVIGHSYIIENDELTFISAQNYIYSFQNGEIKMSFPVSFLIQGALFEYSTNQYIYGRSGEQPLLTFNLQEGIITSLDTTINNLENVSGGMLDRENGLWVTSLSKGLIYIRNPHIRSLANLITASPIIGIQIIDEELWVATRDNHLYSIALNGLLVTRHLDVDGKIFSLLKTGNYVFALIQGEYLEDTSISNKVRIKSAHGSLHFSNDSLWHVSVGQIFLEVKGKRVYFNEINDTHNDPYTSIAKRGDWLYLGSLYGLQKFNTITRKIINEKQVNPLINSRVNYLEHFDKLLLIGTNGSGLYLLDNNDSIVLAINELSGLSSNFCNSIYKENDSTFWVSTNMGVSKVIFSIGLDSVAYSISIFNKYDGLVSNEVSCCLITDNKLFVGTKNGMCFLDLSHQYINNTSPNIIIEKLEVNDSIVDTKNHAEFNYKQNTFRFFVAGLTFKTRGKNHFNYRLIHDGTEEDLDDLNQPSIQFSDLNPGDYKFEVFAINNDGVASLEPATFSFTIFPAWWNTWWFRMFNVSSILLLIYSFYRYRYQQKKARDELDLTTKKLKQKALNAQLNPHFIFNTMGSIQSLIIDEKLPEAEGYLTKFSKMLRTILSSSDEHFINLKNELELVAEYVKLENLRFDNRIELKLNVEGVTSGNVFQAPTLLILTLVENAILHGILPSKKSGRIEITTRIDSKDSSRLQIIIEDNGIGILQSKEIKKSKIHSHKSMGLNIIKDRLETYSSLYKGSFSIHFIDLSTLEEDKTGTRVEIFTPYKAE